MPRGRRGSPQVQPPNHQLVSRGDPAPGHHAAFPLPRFPAPRATHPAPRPRTSLSTPPRPFQVRPGDGRKPRGSQARRPARPARWKGRGWRGAADFSSHCSSQSNCGKLTKGRVQPDLEPVFGNAAKIQPTGLPFFVVRNQTNRTSTSPVLALRRRFWAKPRPLGPLGGPRADDGVAGTLQAGSGCPPPPPNSGVPPAL